MVKLVKVLFRIDILKLFLFLEYDLLELKEGILSFNVFNFGKIVDVICGAVSISELIFEGLGYFLEVDEDQLIVIMFISTSQVNDSFLRDKAIENAEKRVNQTNFNGEKVLHLLDFVIININAARNFFLKVL